MKFLAATGYASVDHVVGVAGRIASDRTTLINWRDPDAWPRAGGCPSYVAAAAARAGQKAHAVCWIGGDAAGHRFKRELKSQGVDVEGVATVAGRPSPTAILAYQPDGGCACLFDPAFPGEERLSAGQRRILRKASHVCITAGPPHLTEDILDCRADRARLYWVLKRDLHAFPSALRDEICRRADVIFCNESERDLIGRTSRDAIIVQTGGENGVIVRMGERQASEPVAWLEILDTTGAGDTLAGGFIAAEMAANASPIDALRRGILSARSLLMARMPARAP